VSLNLHELRELLAALDQTDIAELTLKSDDFELTVRRGTWIEGRLYAIDAAQAGDAMLPPAPTPLAAPSASPRATVPDRAELETLAPAPITSASKNDRKLVEILSPMVGTFYRAPAPDEPSFVEVGDRVQVGQTVCIVEAMKLMNELEAEVAGEIVEILVQNGEPVEYGQPLMRVNPL
jgi:acetyl-CoA carboxylase biotin carboxyl carrier protein